MIWFWMFLVKICFMPKRSLAYKSAIHPYLTAQEFDHKMIKICVYMKNSPLYKDCSKINTTEAVTFAHFNIHVKFNNNRKSEHVLHVLQKFQQIPFRNNYSITNTNNKGSATQGRSLLHKRHHWRHIFPSHETSTAAAPSGRGPVYNIDYIIYYYVENNCLYMYIHKQGAIFRVYTYIYHFLMKFQIPLIYNNNMLFLHA